MTRTDPFDFLNRHRDTVFLWMGVLAALLVVFLVLRFLAMRQGGWTAAAAHVRRECAVTANAFAAPLRAWSRHRRSLRMLVRGLRAPATWRDAERALAAARRAGGRPYAVLVDEDVVTVLVAGRDVTPPADGPWWAGAEDGDVEADGAEDGGAPGHWSMARQDLPPVVPDPGQRPPVLVAVGETDGRCAFLDVATGPAMLCVEGDLRTATALHQAVAAQLDARLPDGLVVVAAGVNREYPGLPLRTAYRAAAGLRPRLGVPPVLVSAELPDPLPPELCAPPPPVPDLRLLLLGPGRGYVRTLLTDRHGQVALLGTSLLTLGIALSRAVVRVLSEIPPVVPPGPPAGAAASGPARPFMELEDDEEPGGADEAAEEQSAGGSTAATLGPPSAERDDVEAAGGAAEAERSWPAVRPAGSGPAPEPEPGRESEFAPETVSALRSEPEAVTPPPAGVRAGTTTTRPH